MKPIFHVGRRFWERHDLEVMAQTQLSRLLRSEKRYCPDPGGDAIAITELNA